nr:SH3 domain-containing protein C23A1.17-like [Nicotiana tomentosiformis]
MDANNPKKKVQPPTTASQSNELAMVAAGAVDVPSIFAKPYSNATAMPPPSSTAPTAAPPSSLKPVPMFTADEPAMVAVEAVDVPSTSAKPSSSAADMPLPSSKTPTAAPSIAPTSALKPVPMPTSPLSAVQSSVQAPQFSSTVEDTLKKLLENQNTIMATCLQHRSVIEELGKEAKKMRKYQASKKSADKLQRQVTRLATAGDLSFDMLLDPDHYVPDPTVPAAPARQSEEPDLAADTAEAVHHMFANPATPRVEDDDI